MCYSAEQVFPTIVCIDCDFVVTYADLDNLHISDELWRFCLVTLEWTHLESPSGDAAPSGRSGHVMTSVGMELWLHGGQTNFERGEGGPCSSPTALLMMFH